MSAGCTAGPCSCLLTQAMDGRIVRCGIISSCQSAGTSEIAKALLIWSPSDVRKAIASSGSAFTFLADGYLPYFIRCLHDRAHTEQLALRSVVISMLIRRTDGL